MIWKIANKPNNFYILMKSTKDDYKLYDPTGNSVNVVSDNPLAADIREFLTTKLEIEVTTTEGGREKVYDDGTFTIIHYENSEEGAKALSEDAKPTKWCSKSYDFALSHVTTNFHIVFENNEPSFVYHYPNGTLTMWDKNDVSITANKYAKKEATALHENILEILSTIYPALPGLEQFEFDKELKARKRQIEDLIIACKPDELDQLDWNKIMFLVEEEPRLALIETYYEDNTLISLLLESNTRKYIFEKLDDNEYNFLDILDKLISFGGNINACNGKALAAVLYYYYIDTSKVLQLLDILVTKYGADINQPKVLGDMLLHRYLMDHITEDEFEFLFNKYNADFQATENLYSDVAFTIAYRGTLDKLNILEDNFNFDSHAYNDTLFVRGCSAVRYTNVPYIENAIEILNYLVLNVNLDPSNIIRCLEYAIGHENLSLLQIVAKAIDSKELESMDTINRCIKQDLRHESSESKLNYLLNLDKLNFTKEDYKEIIKLLDSNRGYSLIERIDMSKILTDFVDAAVDLGISKKEYTNLAIIFIAILEKHSNVTDTTLFEQAITQIEQGAKNHDLENS